MKDREKKYKEFRKALYRLFDSQDGKLVAEVLNDMYVDQTAVDPANKELTYYKLGQKEFVQGLLKDAATEAEDIQLNVKQGEQ